MSTRETAEQVVKQQFPQDWHCWRNLTAAIDAALTNAIADERARAARIICEHRESDKCEGSCWEIITEAIRRDDTEEGGS